MIVCLNCEILVWMKTSVPLPISCDKALSVFFKLDLETGTYFTDTMVEQVKKGNRKNITFKGHSTFTNVKNTPINNRIQF